MRAVGYQKSLPITDAAIRLIDIELPKPEPKGRDLLVEVKAVSVNPVDTKVRMRAEPPAGEYEVLGWDATGVVVAAGPDAKLFKPGDEVSTPARSTARAPTRNSIWSTSASSARSRSRSTCATRPRCRSPRSRRRRRCSTGST